MFGASHVWSVRCDNQDLKKDFVRGELSETLLKETLAAEACIKKRAMVPWFIHRYPLGMNGKKPSGYDVYSNCELEAMAHLVPWFTH